MPVGAAIGVIGSAAIGANAQSKAAKKAANAQVAASDQATALQREQYNDQRNLLTPSITAGATARARQMLMQGSSPEEVKAFLNSTAQAVAGEGGSFTAPDTSWVDGWNYQSSSPSYDFRLGEGQRTLERSAAAKGNLFSGGTGRELTRYGQDFASTEFENDFSRNGQLAGDGQEATGNVVNVSGQFGDAAARNTINAGNARASGYRQAGDAQAAFWNNTIPGAIGYGQGQGWFGK